MRILLASDSFDPAVGGVQRVVRDLADTLASCGHAVEVLAPWAAGLSTREPLDDLLVHRVRLGRPAWNARAIAGFLRRLRPAQRSVAHVLDELHPDVVHLHFLQSPLAYLLPGACARRRVPLVATVHGRDVVGEMVDRDRLGRAAVRRVLAAAAAVTAPSAATLAEARALAPTPLRARYVRVPNALPADLAAELRVAPPRDGNGVVAVGELHPKKGFDVLIRALAELPGVSLRVAGEGPERDTLVRLAQQLGVSDRVELVGFFPRAELAAFLRSAAVQAVPSRREPFGLVLLEGMACGVPVVASDVDGIPEAVGPCGAAVLVPPGDPAALAAALGGLLGDAARRDALVTAGRQRARAMTPAATAAAYEAVYREVLGAA